MKAELIIDAPIVERKDLWVKKNYKRIICTTAHCSSRGGLLSNKNIQQLIEKQHEFIPGARMKKRNPHNLFRTYWEMIIKDVPPAFRSDFRQLSG